MTVILVTARTAGGYRWTVFSLEQEELASGDSATLAGCVDALRGFLDERERDELNHC